MRCLIASALQAEHPANPMFLGQGDLLGHRGATAHAPMRVQQPLPALLPAFLPPRQTEQEQQGWEAEKATVATAANKRYTPHSQTTPTLGQSPCQVAVAFVGVSF